jgi:hypothetical protein
MMERGVLGALICFLSWEWENGIWDEQIPFYSIITGILLFLCSSIPGRRWTGGVKAVASIIDCGAA